MALNPSIRGHSSITRGNGFPSERSVCALPGNVGGGSCPDNRPLDKERVCEIDLQGSMAPQEACSRQDSA